MQLNPYINFDGKTEEAFNFYKSIFGGEFGQVMRFGDVPGEAEKLPADQRNKIMHIGLAIGGNVLMGTDMLEAHGFKLKEGNNFNLSVSPDSKDQADKIFNGLAAGGKITMPIADQFWGDYFGS